MSPGPRGGESGELRARLLSRFDAVRSATEALAAPLSPEDQVLQSMPDASPTKWHRAHTTWFFEEFIVLPRGMPCHDARGRYLWNSYYEVVGDRHPRPRRGMLSRPTCDEIAAYRAAVDGRMRELLETAEDLVELAPLVELGLAHEEQHQELLLTDILHAFSQSALRPAYRAGAKVEAPRGEALGWVAHAGGLVEIGHAGPGFSFDNEGPRHKVWLEPFVLATRPVTVGEVRAFAEAGGYRTPSLWLAEGLDFVRQGGIDAPLHTTFADGTCRVFGLDGEREARDDEPAAHLSYYEADAIARFLGARLPTEAEWEVAAFESGTHERPKAANFREGGALRPLPSAGRGLFGDVWTWTASAYAPYPGFAPSAGAVGEYNGKFMVNQMVLRGGSCFTPAGHVRATYRNFWPAGTRFQMTGVRLAKSV